MSSHQHVDNEIRFHYHKIAVSGKSGTDKTRFADLLSLRIRAHIYSISRGFREEVKINKYSHNVVDQMVEREAQFFLRNYNTVIIAGQRAHELAFENPGIFKILLIADEEICKERNDQKVQMGIPPEHLRLGQECDFNPEDFNLVINTTSWGLHWREIPEDCFEELFRKLLQFESVPAC